MEVFELDMDRHKDKYTSQINTIPNVYCLLNIDETLNE